MPETPTTIMIRVATWWLKNNKITNPTIEDLINSLEYVATHPYYSHRVKDYWDKLSNKAMGKLMVEVLNRTLNK